MSNSLEKTPALNSQTPVQPTSALSSHPIPKDVAERFSKAMRPSHKGEAAQSLVTQSKEHGAEKPAKPLVTHNKEHGAGIFAGIDNPFARHGRGEGKESKDSAGQTDGNTVLAALQGNHSPAPSASDAFSSQEVRHAGPTRGAEAQLHTQLAERILSSLPTANTPAEVRISLKESVLPDTEIRIQRTEKSLEVQFVTGSNTTEQVLSPQLRDLQTTLSQRFTGEVRVSLERPDMDGNAQGDGRSRQQRNLFEELADEQKHA